MRNAFKIFGFTVLVLAFYAYIGQMVPQERNEPPQTADLSANMTTEEMVKAGREIFTGKGTCTNCHAVEEGEGTGRFPNLHNIGATASERREGDSELEYLAESLYKPNAYVVEGYTPAMPPMSEPPIGLSDQEIKAVIAYLQSLDGTPTISMGTTLKYEENGTASAQTASSEESASATASAEASRGKELFNKHLCNTCHRLDEPTDKVGPSLYDVGSRLSRAKIREAIMKPDATVREGYPAGTMKTTLEGANFYEQVTDEEMNTLIDFLASQTGD